jgi:thiamine biosynthesis protein ThiS
MNGRDDVLQIEVNGEPRTVAAGTTIADLVSELGLRPEQVAVERNRKLVRRDDHAATPLADGDRLEVVTFFGGG